MFFLLRSLVPLFYFFVFCLIFMLRWHAASSSGMQHVMCVLLHLHFASSSGTQHRWEGWGGWGGVLCSLVPFSKFSKKTGTQVIDRKWKALKDFLPRNYHRKINGPHGSQVNLLLRKCVFQFCWRNSLKSPSPAQFLKHLAKLQSRKRQLVALVFKMLKKCIFFPECRIPLAGLPK